ncbi:MAG: AAA family ATPase [candidate division NC10 bacterium]|nr:AAA family ATPase [candidate division NC10 bacterium]
MSYEQFYQLREQPFSNTPDPRFYFDIPQHTEVVARLMHAINAMKGLAVVVGDVGTGKTTLARQMLERLDDDQYASALLVIVHSSVTPEWLLRKIAMQLGVDAPAEEKVTLLSQIYQGLLQIHQGERKAVVLVDEANMLKQKEIMEEFRGLLNLEVPKAKLITFILFGLPELDENLTMDLPLAQRVAVKCRLTSFTPEITKAYIRHRLKVAGSTKELFDQEVMDRIHVYSGGIPRLINTICDNVLLEGFLLRRDRLDLELVEDVVSDLGLGAVNAGSPHPSRRHP